MNQENLANLNAYMAENALVIYFPTAMEKGKQSFAKVYMEVIKILQLWRTQLSLKIIVCS